MPEVVRVSGYRDFLRACKFAEADSRREVRAAFRQVGEVVRVDAEQLFDRYSARSAAGFKVRVRQRGIAVEQSLRKTTGRRPDWGSLQMTRALLPARRNTYEVSQAAFGRALDRVADHFDHV